MCGAAPWACTVVHPLAQQQATQLGSLLSAIERPSAHVSALLRCHAGCQQPSPCQGLCCQDGRGCGHWRRHRRGGGDHRLPPGRRRCDGHLAQHGHPCWQRVPGSTASSSRRQHMPRLDGRCPDLQAAGLQPGCGRPAGQPPQGLLGGWGGRRAGSGGRGGGRGGCAIQTCRRSAEGRRRSMQAAAEPGRSGPSAVSRLAHLFSSNKVSLSCILCSQGGRVQSGQGSLHQGPACIFCERQSLLERRQDAAEYGPASRCSKLCNLTHSAVHWSAFSCSNHPAADCQGYNASSCLFGL